AMKPTSTAAAPLMKAASSTGTKTWVDPRDGTVWTCSSNCRYVWGSGGKKVPDFSSPWNIRYTDSTATGVSSPVPHSSTDYVFANTGTSSAAGTAITGGGSGGSVTPVTQTVQGPNGTFGQATLNSNGTVTVSNNLGSVTLTPQQMNQVAAGDMSP